MPPAGEVSLGSIGTLATAWAAVGVATALGVLPLSLIDMAVLLAIAVVAPLALGGPAWWWAGAGGSTATAFLAPPGYAALLVLPVATAVVAALLPRLAAARPIASWDLHDGATLLAPVYALVACTSLAASRAGLKLFGIGEPIVELTAVHYLYAGTGALILAATAQHQSTAATGAVAQAGVILTALAPPIVAIGFVSGAAPAQVGGAVVMTIGVWLTAGVQLIHAGSGARPAPQRALLVLSGLAVWVPMVLAVSWAAGQHWDIPALSIPAMARAHGLPNAIAFIVGGLLARHCALAGPRRQHAAVRP